MRFTVLVLLIAGGVLWSCAESQAQTQPSAFNPTMAGANAARLLYQVEVCGGAPGHLYAPLVDGLEVMAQATGNHDVFAGSVYAIFDGLLAITETFDPIDVCNANMATLSERFGANIVNIVTNGRSM